MVSLGTLVVLLGSGVVPASATAATCGSTSAAGRGVLNLDADEAVTDAVFRQRTGHKTLSLVFRVNGCDLPANAPPPVLEVNPRRGLDELPDSGAAITVRRVVVDGPSLDVLLDVDAGKFDPGSYGASLVLRSPYLSPSRTSVSVSRSEHRALVPAFVGALAAAAGLLVFGLLQTVRHARLVVGSRVVLGLVLLVGVAVGAILGYVNYRNQDVWTFSENWIAAATAGFGGSTGGVMAGLLGGLLTKAPDA